MNSNPSSATSQNPDEFAIIETDDGLTVVMLESGVTVEETAARHRGVLIDAGPYKSYDEAYDAVVDLMEDSEERE